MTNSESENKKSNIKAEFEALLGTKLYSEKFIEAICKNKASNLALLMAQILRMDESEQRKKLDQLMFGACQYGLFEVAEYMANEKNAIINDNENDKMHRPGFNCFPIEIACEYGHEDIATMLVEKGANLDNNAINICYYKRLKNLVDLMCERRSKT